MNNIYNIYCVNISFVYWQNNLSSNKVTVKKSAERKQGEKSHLFQIISR